jgi:hypothetical protein
MPDRPKSGKDDCVQLTIITTNFGKEEQSAFISLDNEHIKEMYKLFGDILKVNDKQKK